MTLPHTCYLPISKHCFSAVTRRKNTTTSSTTKVARNPSIKRPSKSKDLAQEQPPNQMAPIRPVARKMSKDPSNVEQKQPSFGNAFKVFEGAGGIPSKFSRTTSSSTADTSTSTAPQVQPQMQNQPAMQAQMQASMAQQMHQPATIQTPMPTQTQAAEQAQTPVQAQDAAQAQAAMQMQYNQYYSQMAAMQSSGQYSNAQYPYGFNQYGQMQNSMQTPVQETAQGQTPTQVPGQPPDQTTAAQSWQTQTQAIPGQTTMPGFYQEPTVIKARKSKSKSKSKDETSTAISVYTTSQEETSTESAEPEQVQQQAMQQQVIPQPGVLQQPMPQQTMPQQQMPVQTQPIQPQPVQAVPNKRIAPVAVANPIVSAQPEEVEEEEIQENTEKWVKQHVTNERQQTNSAHLVEIEDLKQQLKLQKQQHELDLQKSELEIEKVRLQLDRMKVEYHEQETEIERLKEQIKVLEETNLLKIEQSNNSDVTGSVKSVSKLSVATNKTERFVVALYSYTGQTEDELTFAKGDRIRVLSKDIGEPGWMEGELNGVSGVIPANFVKESAEKEPAAEPKSSPEPKKSKSKPESEIAEEEVEDHEDSEEEDDDSEEGLSDEEESEKSEEANEDSDYNVNYEENPIFIAKFGFEGTAEDELSFAKGDEIEQLQENIGEIGWAKGRTLKNNKTGIYPTNYVKVKDATKQNLKKAKSKTPTPQQPQPDAKTELANKIKMNSRKTNAKRTSSSGIVESILTNNEHSDSTAAFEKHQNFEKYVARYPYAATQDDELSFEKGDKIDVITKNTEEDGWWKGKHTVTGDIGIFPGNYMKENKKKQFNRRNDLL